jgi:hypothetical protein
VEAGTFRISTAQAAADVDAIRGRATERSKPDLFEDFLLHLEGPPRKNH